MRLFRQFSRGEKYTFCKVRIKIRKWKWIIVASVLVCAMIGFVWSVLV